MHTTLQTPRWYMTLQIETVWYHQANQEQTLQLRTYSQTVNYRQAQITVNYRQAQTTVNYRQAQTMTDVTTFVTVYLVCPHISRFNFI